MQSTDLSLAVTLVDTLAARLGPRLMQATLFGSRVKGTAWPGSDYDLFVLLDRDDPATRDVLYDAAYDFVPADINFHIYTPERMAAAHRLGSPVLRAVDGEGVPLWPKTPASPPIA